MEIKFLIDQTPWIGINQIQPHPSNPNEHTPEQIKKIARSIDELDWGRPIIISSDNYILIGHGAYEAAKDILHQNKVPYRRVEHIHSSSEAIALMLSDNKLAELSNWNYGKLQPLQHNLEIAGFDTALTGFEDTELQEIENKLEKPKDVVEDEFDLDKVTERICQKGDIWQLGKHRLMCGDSTKQGDVEKLMNRQLSDIVFTDPPYGVDYSGGATAPREKLKGDKSTSLYMPCCEMAAKFSTDEAPLYLWHAGVKATDAATAATAAGYKIRCQIIWNKNQAQYGALGAQYKQKHEPCYYCYKEGKTVNWNGPTNEITVWDIERSQKNEYHPTQKPIALAARAISNHNVKKVLDLFGGSGSTLMACEQLKKQCYTMELDPHYCDVIISRWEEFTGQKAQLKKEKKS